MSLKIKTKLRYGIGLLFAMIVLLGGISVKNISDMSADTRNILADNYNSLLYSRRMLDALERIDSDPSAQADFEKNLGLQKKNITEVDENVATSHLVAQYEQLAKERNEENIRRVRLALNQVMSLNMASIYRKSQVAESTSQKALFWIWGIGLSCMVVAFAFLIRFPRSINTPIRMLMDGIMEIANHNYEKRLDLAKYDEFEGVAKSFNRMAERLTEYRKSTLADIIQGKKYIEAIVNSITEPIIGLDRDRKILFANNEALTILNLKRENVIGKSASELSLRNDLLRRLVRELIQPSEKKEPLKIYADNKESYFQVQYIPIRVLENGEAEVYVGDVILLKNITEFKELDSAKTTFISTISHELKTPISAIMMSLKLLEDARVGAMNDEQKALAESISKIAGGCALMEGAIVNGAILAQNSVINTKAVIEHGCILGNNVFVGPGAIVCGDTCIGDNVLVGAGVIIRDGIEITENVTIGMGSVVVRSIVEPGVYLGNPCRKIR